jgi:S-DNA-T family DNA segregation ATPase FtsK/SpoIIIE
LLYINIFVAMSANSLKNNTSSKKTGKQDDFKPEPKAKKTTNTVPFFKDEKNKRIVGVFLALIAIFLLVAMYSYIGTWYADQDKVLGANNIFSFLIDKTTHVANKAGKIGALTAHQLIYNGFGLLSFLLIPLFGGWAFNLFSIKFKFKTLQYVKYAGIPALLLSPLLAFIFNKSTFPFGGLYGNSIVVFLQNFAGSIGTGFILVGMCFATFIALFNPSFAFLNTWAEKREAARLAKEKADKQTLFTEKEREKLAKESALLQQDNLHYEEKEGELFIHQSFNIEDDEKQELTKVTPSTNEYDEEEELVDTKDLEFTVTTPAEQSTPSNDNAIQLSTDVIEPPANIIKIEGGDMDMEVVQKPDEPEVIEKPHSSVEGLEPYDPSLELSNYKYPTIDLLEDRGTEALSVTKEELEMHKNQIIQTLKNFGINIAKISATVGPTVTLYEIVPAEGVRISKIRNLEDDIALSLAALGIRIIAPIPGKGTIGIEVPNLKKQIVNMRTLIASDKFVNNNFSLPIAIGKKIDNENYVVDLATMPHLLMAGATGQGKSVGLNAILVSLLYKKHPSQLKFVLVDPKKVELSIYKMIEKHFLAKLPNEEESIITDTKKVVNTLNSLCIEMDQRYDLLKEAGVRNIKEYNEKFIARKLNPQKGHHYLPFIVLVVDEFADLIMTAGKEVEMPIARLAQLARAIGIHLIIATQRPSVNVITGTIKANFPARIAFRVSAKVDSRTILDAGGAEQLVGKGDLLISNGSELVRVQCAFVDTPEVERIIEFIGNQRGYPTAYDLPEYVGADGDIEMNINSKNLTELDQMFEQCARLVVSSGSGSTSMLQRRFNLGYNRAGRIMDQLEAAGIVGPSVGGKPRDLIIKVEMELEEVLLRLPLK